MQDQKPPKFKTFYLYASIVWGLLFVVFIGMSIINHRFYAGTSLNKFTDGLLETILIMGIIGIPLIMLLTCPF
ncbi:MAG: hypothetical protein K9G67_08250 [Bacteroidales bacterium]|nr:hypothetical protein [Bacteroidales bacterium]MCF8350785.1 hypothetical protein [Bacteroidales bacterium]MCF8376329.1 hypothetical protein [Bacteroidales bacterium]MCF8400495.1 hypothetical protein [Bacteroidales bacterium]